MKFISLKKVNNKFFMAFMCNMAFSNYSKNENVLNIFPLHILYT